MIPPEMTHLMKQKYGDFNMKMVKTKINFTITLVIGKIGLSK